MFDNPLPLPFSYNTLAFHSRPIRPLEISVHTFPCIQFSYPQSKLESPEYEVKNAFFYFLRNDSVTGVWRVSCCESIFASSQNRIAFGYPVLKSYVQSPQCCNSILPAQL